MDTGKSATVLRLILIAFYTRYACAGDNFKMGSNTNVAEAMQFLREYDREASGMCYRVTTAQWKFVTNITEYNRRRMTEQLALSSKFERLSWRKAAAFDSSRLHDPQARRKLMKIVQSSRAALPEDKFNELQQLISEMKEIYNSAKICPFGQKPYDPHVPVITRGSSDNQDRGRPAHQQYQLTNQPFQHYRPYEDNPDYPNYCDMQLDPEISRILAHSRIDSELVYVWKSFRDKTGPKLKNRFMRYVQLANQAAVNTGFRDAGEQMRSAYEDPSLRVSVEEIYNQLAPLYKQLFTYVRRRLIQRYGNSSIRADGPIPAHYLGNMWAQNWKSIMDLVMPFPTSPTLDVTAEMLRQGFTPLRMFQMAEEFYTSMGLKPLPPEFWRGSMLVRPQRAVQCTASAWDFCNRIDYRIKQCTEVTTQDLVSTHHELAHVQYYLHYAELPQLFRDGANPAFHEAVANAATLSLYNIPHLQRMGLYHNNTHDSYEVSMNFLMSMALEKVAYLPFAFMVDQWRWTIFEEGVENMNARWWQMKLRYQGVVPPLPRTEDDFDPGAKYHVISDQEYMKYFLATILEFQIFEQLCIAAGHSGHLHECDVYRSREAGRVLSEIMQAGSSKPAGDIIRTMTRGRTNRISPEALVQYFRPLELWLRAQNHDAPLIGWYSDARDVSLFSPRVSGNSPSCVRIPNLLLAICCLYSFMLPCQPMIEIDLWRAYRAPLKHQALTHVTVNRMAAAAVKQIHDRRRWMRVSALIIRASGGAVNAGRSN
ncbi:angiotensin-converting enzyme-like [Battus philenor]|uniref:angiotensin-converting enzyme-like n=1 Tax=Battus philenor TaxID=42288 RepID=UPI0035CEE301